MLHPDSIFNTILIWGKSLNFFRVSLITYNNNSVITCCTGVLRLLEKPVIFLGKKKVLFVFARNREKRSSNRTRVFDVCTGLFGSVWDHVPVMLVWEKLPFMDFCILGCWVLFILLHSYQNNLSEQWEGDSGSLLIRTLTWDAGDPSSTHCFKPYEPNSCKICVCRTTLLR